MRRDLPKSRKFAATAGSTAAENTAMMGMQAPHSSS
jgi:hypothetical protein